MKVFEKSIGNLSFLCRPDTSDEKTIDEVIGRGVYEKRGIVIEAGEKWLDLGGNIGAFAVLAASKGATVEVWEPDPGNFELLEENIRRNGFGDKVATHKAAVVANRNGKAYLNISKTKQYWRNSLMRNLGGGVIEVETVHFSDIIKPGLCVKMDIEGSEMPIIEKWHIEGVPKLVFEWSFDIDDNIQRYRDAVAHISKYFTIVKADKIAERHTTWLKSWFPPCKNIYCYNQ